MKRIIKRREEIFNSITHSLGVIFGVVALTILLFFSIRNGQASQIVAFSIYGFSIITMYLCSTLYHSFKKPNIKKFLRVFDHSSIFLFIAGTYTPIILLTLKGSWRIALIALIWAIALAGVIFKILTYGKFDTYKLFSVVIYLAMGWIAVIPIRMIIRATSWEFFAYIVAGGVIYSIGTIFYSMKKLPYTHVVWHLFVLVASIVHFIGIFKFLT